MKDFDATAIENEMAKWEPAKQDNDEMGLAFLLGDLEHAAKWLPPGLAVKCLALAEAIGAHLDTESFEREDTEEAEMLARDIADMHADYIASRGVK